MVFFFVEWWVVRDFVRDKRFFEGLIIFEEMFWGDKYIGVLVEFGYNSNE